jgi:dTDP-glucose 4,6-dehydratase
MKKLSKILVTGGAGFIGSAFVRRMASSSKVVVVDKLTYAGKMARLKDVKNQIVFYKTDINDEKKLNSILIKEKPDSIIHFAAETHVDRSLHDPSPFIKTNIEGTYQLIQLSIRHKIKKFIHISSDEVYGENKSNRRFQEKDSLNPTNPYSVTKGTAELLIHKAVLEDRFPALIVRPTNTYGPGQYPEKLIPVVITQALRNCPVPVYGKGKQIREWLYVDDCVSAVHWVMEKGKIGEAYNIGSGNDYTNLNVVKHILRILNKPVGLIAFVNDRPGHDFCYGVNNRKIRQLGWKPSVSFLSGLTKTIQWYSKST